MAIPVASVGEYRSAQRRNCDSSSTQSSIAAREEQEILATKTPLVSRGLIRMKSMVNSRGVNETIDVFA